MESVARMNTFSKARRSTPNQNWLESEDFEAHDEEEI